MKSQIMPWNGLASANESNGWERVILEKNSIRKVILTILKKLFTGEKNFMVINTINSLKNVFQGCGRLQTR